MSADGRLAERTLAVAPRSEVALDRLRRVVGERAVLRPPFEAAMRRWRAADPVAVEALAAAALRLLDVNAGPACLTAFWRLDAGMAGLPVVIEAGAAAAAICRHAGAGAALASLEAAPVAWRRCDDRAAWWQGLERLAEAAPALVGGFAGQAERLFDAVGGKTGAGAAIADFVTAGLKATLRDRARRRALFALDHPLAAVLLARSRADAAGFAEAERMLSAFAAGLWGSATDAGPRLAVATGAGGVGSGGPRRAAISAGTVLLPAVFSGVPASRARALYRAAVAHAGAHLAHAGAPFEPRQLRPLQIALIGLIEDARVEALAIRRLPGLRALWRPWHVVRVSQEDGRRAHTVAELMARLACALLDPDHADPDGFVAKGRRLFAEAAGRLDDPAISRAIGGLLGNDLGQMRLQFDARGYVVEPAYRDDNLHLWRFEETDTEQMALSVEAARGDTEGGDRGAGDRGAPQARSAGQIEDRGPVLALYPEWDSLAGVERPDWTTLRDAAPRLRPQAPADGAGLTDALIRLLAGSAVGPRRRGPRQDVGELLDLDAAIDFQVARRAGVMPDARLYRDRIPPGRELATLIILDSSRSTAAIADGGRSVLHWECCAVAALAEALEHGGDRYALRAFSSAGRDDVRLTRLKDFDETLTPLVRQRLAGLEPALSTRLGAALRHAGRELDEVATARRMVLVLTDGEPADIDAGPGELAEDARRAVSSLRRAGIDVFGLVIGQSDGGAGATIFGKHNTLPVQRLAELPEALAAVYFRLSRR